MPLQTNPLRDKQFLKKLDLVKNKKSFVRITMLTADELPIKTIEGLITTGSINIDGNSSMRRTCNLTFLATEENNDLTNIDNLLSINKKIKIETGLENTIDDRYNDIIWFKQGIFVIVQPSITHNLQSVTISLSCKDKMCLLNGECGGTLPASVIFDSYNQVLESGEVVSIKTLVYDIIETLLLYYGNEIGSKIFINDVPLEIKQIVRWTGSENLYYNPDTQMYTLNSETVFDNLRANNISIDNEIDNNSKLTEEEKLRAKIEKSTWEIFNYNDDIGYAYVDFVYPNDLTSGIGENVCSVLDKIKNFLGNFEYYYDIDGNFIFQEIKNYLNNSYTMMTRKVDTEKNNNNLAILDNTNYYMDLDIDGKIIYDFTTEGGLISSFSNSISYTNLKNDFHVWGENNNKKPIHFHIAIKKRPSTFSDRSVVCLKNEDNKLSGRIRLATEEDKIKSKDENEALRPHYIEKYKPADWRAELYLRGLEALRDKKRPEPHQQELLDLFDAIYDFSIENEDGTYGAFKTDIINTPNNLLYFMDYLEPTGRIVECSIDMIGQKVHTYHSSNINRIYETAVPNVIIVNINEENEERDEIIDRCENEGQPYSNVDEVIYSKIAFNTKGYSAENNARELLYQYTNYISSINIQAIPIYYLEPNRRITVYDKKSNIYGDYIIKTISLPLDGKSTMTISATKALERI